MHVAALQARHALGHVQILTTDEVLAEFMTALSGRGSFFRQIAVGTVRTLLNDKMVTVLSQSRETFLAALDFYENRPDKEYSLTGCGSMLTMRRHGISDVLTNDHHFTQEGLHILIPQ
jgi:predicted nucleic acid-binding protein